MNIPIDSATIDYLESAAVALLRLTTTNGTKAQSEALASAVERLVKERAAWLWQQRLLSETPRDPEQSTDARVPPVSDAKEGKVRA